MPFILATIYKALPPSPSDWCEMALPDDSGLAWFNKRTSEVRRERPPEMDAPTSPSATAVGAATATTATTAKEAVLKNTETLDALLTWLDWGACGHSWWWEEEGGFGRGRLTPRPNIPTPQNLRRRTSTRTGR